MLEPRRCRPPSRSAARSFMSSRMPCRSQTSIEPGNSFTQRWSIAVSPRHREGRPLPWGRTLAERLDLSRGGIPRSGFDACRKILARGRRRLQSTQQPKGDRVANLLNKNGTRSGMVLDRPGGSQTSRKGWKVNWVRPTSGLGLALGLLCSLLQAAPLEPVPELSGLDRGATVPAELYQLHDTHALAQALVERVFRLTRAKDTRPKLGPLKRTEPVHHFDLQKDARLLMHLKLEAVTDPQRFSGYVTRGFLNLHQTGSTGGLDKPEVRALLEDDLALLRLEEEYNPDPSNRVHELRPKYLVLDLTGEVVVGGRRHDAAHYGNLVFVFKEQ